MMNNGSYLFKGKPKIEGRNKFAPLESNLALFSIPAWAQGLTAVDTSFSNLVQQTKTLAHLGAYTFPDPALFVTANSDGKKALLLTMWLMCREAWLACVASHDDVVLPAQGWREVLFMDFTATPLLSDTKASARQEEALRKFKLETLRAFHNDPQYATGQPMKWNGALYTPGRLPPANVVQEVLWELYELNFTDLNAVYERQIIITCCFLFLAFKQPTELMLTANRGLAANTAVDQLPHLLQLAKLMSSWEGNKPAIFALHECKSQDSISQAQIAELERAVVCFYCQTFYNYFGHAAQIPHCLFYMQ
ncbi:hypothetical protein BJ165DRAFT_1533810 [Panaeolus papilionaceus]|nr:hypothetical protein BJ165DRAFT_1533810 [Panaeolus papilionaceus]